MTKKHKSSRGVLSHRSFTGKKLPKQYTSYPIVAFILLCLGVLLTGLTVSTHADTINVTAYAEGPAPPDPAIILSPSENDRFTTKPITVSGSCPATYMVKLYRNNIFSGAVLCGGDNTFSLQTDLFAGGNLLTARVFNAVDDEGPSSPSITVYYDAPEEPEEPGEPGGGTPSPSGGDDGGSGNEELIPFLISAENKFLGYYVGDTVIWNLNLAGGIGPYAVSVDWGDDKTSLISRKNSGDFRIQHVYDEKGGYRDSYVIKVTATDSAGNTTFIQLVVIVRDRAQQASAALPTGLGGITGSPNLSLGMLWPLYGITLLMVASFWLGERREFFRLHHQLKLHHK